MRLPISDQLLSYLAPFPTYRGILGQIIAFDGEHELQQGRKYARSTKRQSQSKQNKSAITDHVNTENHVINCDEATIIGRESDRTTRWIREAVKI